MTEEGSSIPGAPHASPVGLWRRVPFSADDFVGGQPASASYRASGKSALRAGLSLVAGSGGEEVLLPALLPPGVVRAVERTRCVPRFYPVDPDLGFDAGTVDELVTDRTAALLAVQYFGFPQPRMGEASAITDRNEVALIDDSSHGPFSVRDGRALGTFGDLGFASFHKPLRVPDGAVLYVDESSPRLAPGAGSDVPGESPVPTPGLDDLAYLADGVVERMYRRMPRARRPIRGVVAAARRLADRRGSARGDGARGAPDGQMSWLTLRALRCTDPTVVRRERRAAYRAWERGLDRVGGVEPLFDGLPDGVCPWVFPVRTDDAERFLDRIGARVDGAFRWPDLPERVAGDDRFPTANRLAGAVVCLPAHRDVEGAAVRRVCAALR